MKIKSVAGTDVIVDVDSKGSVRLSYHHSGIDAPVSYFATHDLQCGAWTGCAESKKVGIMLPAAATQQIHDLVAAAQQRIADARDTYESGLIHHRVLEMSGHYLCDQYIRTIGVLPAEEQDKYSHDYRGRVATTLRRDTAHKIDMRDSATATAIAHDHGRPGVEYTYASVESRLIVLSDVEADTILAEYVAAQTAQQACRDERTAEQARRIEDIFARARATGQPQVIATWVTSQCMAGLDDCSFDAATRLAMPDGTDKTMYDHCF